MRLRGLDCLPVSAVPESVETNLFPDEDHCSLETHGRSFKEIEVVVLWKGTRSREEVLGFLNKIKRFFKV